MTTPPLLAILVVTSSDMTSPSKHLLFHYPPHPRPHSLDTADYARELPSDDSASDISSASSASSSSSTSTSDTFSLTSSHISHIATSENTNNITTANNNRYTIDEDEEHHDSYDQDEVDDERSAYQKRRVPVRVTEWTAPLFGLRREDLAEALIPKDALCDRKFELSLDDVVFLGHPVHLPSRKTVVEAGTSPSNSIDEAVDSKEVIVHKVGMGKFHIVFVMNPSWRLDYHEHVSKMYNEVVKKFTEACRTEEIERGYLSLEAAKIHKIMREAEDNELPMSMVWEEIIHTSNLAHSISALYASLLHSKVCLLDLNARQEIAFHIKAIHQISSLPELGTHPFHERNIPLLSTAHGFGESDEQADQVLAPKYTLLLLDEPAEILKKMPTRPAHRRKNWDKFVNGIRPTITFRRVSRDQQLPISLILSMAREVTDLGLARAIPPLSNRGIYIVSPIAPIHALPSHTRAFKTRFPTAPPLPTLLSQISSAEPRRWDHFLATFRLPSTILPFLMRTGWLTQIRQFYFIRIPRNVKLACLEGEEEEVGDTVLVDPYRASREEVRWIRALAEEVARHGDEVSSRIFVRFVKYFDGKSAKEKILRREQVERSELEGMIEAVRRVGGIIVAEHW